jgi:hypothetical protein
VKGDDQLDPATVAVLAHGLLNGLNALNVAIEVLMRTHPDRDLAERLAGIIGPQQATMTDTMRLLAQGLPDDVVELLSRPGGPAPL